MISTAKYSRGIPFIAGIPRLLLKTPSRPITHFPTALGVARQYRFRFLAIRRRRFSALETVAHLRKLRKCPIQNMQSTAQLFLRPDFRRNMNITMTETFLENATSAVSIVKIAPEIVLVLSTDLPLLRKGVISYGATSFYFEASAFHRAESNHRSPPD